MCFTSENWPENEKCLLDDSLIHLTIHAMKYSLSHSIFQAVYQELD